MNCLHPPQGEIWGELGGSEELIEFLTMMSLKERILEQPGESDARWYVWRDSACDFSNCSEG